MKYVIDGEKEYYCNNEKYLIRNNQFVILNNCSELTTVVRKNSRGISFFFDYELINDIKSWYSNDNSSIEFLSVIHNCKDKYLFQLINRFTNYYKLGITHQNTHLESSFYELSDTIITSQLDLNASFRRQKIRKHRTQELLFKNVIRAKEYMHDNLSEKVTLQSISREVGLSKYYLHRLFKSVIGVSPAIYLSKIRIQAAKERLRNTPKRIEEVAIECGFENASYFCNVFKKIEGTSPSSYRRKS